MRPAIRSLDDVKALFIDRADEVDYFREDLWPGESELPVYYITGGSEIGKTWLLRKFYLECNSQSLLNVMLDFNAWEFTDYMAILLEIQGAFAGHDFRHFREQTAQAALEAHPRISPGPGDAGQAISITGGDVSDLKISDSQLAARDMYNIYLQNSDHLSRPHLVTNITKAFLDDLVEYVGDRIVIFMFDDIGKDSLDSRTRRWLIQEFVVPLCHGLLPGARFVITQKEKPVIELETALDRWTEWHTLTEFSGDERTLFELYRTYLVEKHGIPAGEVSDAMLLFFHRLVQGKPAKMFREARNCKRELRKAGRLPS